MQMSGKEGGEGQGGFGGEGTGKRYHMKKILKYSNDTASTIANFLFFNI